MVVVRVHSVVRKRSGGGGYTPTVSLPSEVYKAWGEPKSVLVVLVGSYPGRPVLLLRPARTRVLQEVVRGQNVLADLAELVGNARIKVRAEPGQVEAVLARHMAEAGEPTAVIATSDRVATDTGLLIELNTPAIVEKLARSIAYLYTGSALEPPKETQVLKPAAAKIVALGDLLRILYYA